MQTFVIVPVGYPVDQATQLAIANSAAGFFTGIPPVWADQASAEGWTLPCLITQSIEGDDAGQIVAWVAL